MANLKEIRKRIVSVQNTQKITRAMTMISASKLHRARLDIENSRYYNQALKEMVLSLQQKAVEHLEVFLEKEETEQADQKVAILLYTSDRGLCGALNSSLCKKLESFMSEKQLNPELFIIGKKGKDFFQSKDFSIQNGHYRLKENILKQEVPKSAQSLIRDFLNGEYKAIYLAFNYFKSAITQEPCIQKLLPLALPTEPEKPNTERTESEQIVNKKKDENTELADFIFEPSTKEVCEQLIPTYLENLCYLCLLDNFACEHASRMRVMDSATNNANDLISKLQIQYNRARQANITTELTEIISGAESIN